MNIDFNILWFEDNEKWFNAEKRQVEHWISSLAFQPNIIWRKTMLGEKLEEDLLLFDYDLILVDLNLGNNDSKEVVKGSEVIREIRNKHVLANVLLYSTDGVDAIKQILQQEVLEGVYLSPRNEHILEEKIKQLIRLVVKRAEDILNVRGLLMDNVSEFDGRMKGIIKDYLSIASEDKSNRLNKYAFNLFEEQIEKNTSKGNSIKNDFILKGLEESFLLDSSKLSQIVNKIFKEENFKIDEMKCFHENFKNKILKDRNQLAHAQKDKQSQGVFSFKDKQGNAIQYDSKKCREIRQNIQEFRILLEKAHDYIIQVRKIGEIDKS